MNAITMMQDARGCLISLNLDGDETLIYCPDRWAMKRQAKELAEKHSAKLYNIKRSGTKVECRN